MSASVSPLGSPLVVGVPKEIKNNENRVSVQPDGVAELVHHGHQVVVEAGAGTGSRFSDAEYTAAGAKVVGTADEVFAAADLIVKAKEPVPADYHRLRAGQQLFTYLHLAANRQLTEFLLERSIDSIAYETVGHPAVPGQGRRQGDTGAAQADPALALGLSTLRGQLVNESVAQAHGLAYRNPADLLLAG